MPLFVTALPSFQVEGVDPSQRDQPLTFHQPVGELPIVDDSRWSSSVTDNSLTALLVWIVLLIALQAVTWPLVRRVFSRFPDSGWAFTRLTSILLAGYGVWLLSSVQIIAFTAIWAASAILVLAVVSWVAARWITAGADHRSWWGNPVVIVAEALFWASFALFLTYRFINPDSYHPIWGGEKPMEFAHLNAILRSAHFPPVDPWYSGGYINYYYYGTYLVAFLIKLTGIPAEIAFNLAQSTFPALLAASSFSLSAAIGKRLTGSTGGAIVSGLVGAFFVQFAGNFIVAARLIDRARNGLGPVNGFSYWVFDPTRAIPDADRPINITEFPYFGALYADLHPHVIAMPFTILTVALAWQITSQWRTVPVALSRRRAAREAAFALLVPLALAAVGLGTLFMTNAWDLPMYAAIVGVAVVMATRGIPRIVARLLVSLVVLFVIGVTAWLLILPFTSNYVALFGEIAAVRDRTPLLAIESHLGGQILLMTLGIQAVIASRFGFPRPTITPYAVASICLLAIFLLIQLRSNEGNETWSRIGELGTVAVIVGMWVTAAWCATGARTEFNADPAALKTILVEVVAVTLALLLLDRLVLALYLGIGLSAAVLWFSLRRPSARFLIALIAGGSLLGASLELVYLIDDLSGTDWYRMNTIFKFYNEIWNLFGIAAGVLTGHAVWAAAARTGARTALTVGPGGYPNASVWAKATTVILIPIVIGSLAYAVVATPIRLEQSWGERNEWTLNAYQWMEYASMPLQQGGVLTYRDDLAAINWFNENVPGTPVIAEAAFGPYRCNGSRFSIATGLPAAIGWQRHEQQQRYLDDLGSREGALRELYTTPSVDVKREIIERYGIEYIIVGDTERHYPTVNGNDCIDTGSPEGIAALESMAGGFLEVAFQQGTTTVYRVTGD
jgi:YYY domain-containing protein